MTDASKPPAAIIAKPKRLKHFLLAVAIIFAAGFLIPENAAIPVAGATRGDWNPRSFWFEPWGVSGVHKGIDIFAREGTDVLAATPSVVLYRGQWRDGGNVLIALGPKWRLHYYAHLLDFGQETPIFIARGTAIGRVGSSGNAIGKAPHLHYSIVSLLPIPWLYSRATQGWKRMFYLDPGAAIAGE